MNARRLSPSFLRRSGIVLLGLTLLMLCLLVGQAPPVQASLYWASANGILPLSSGVRSSTPSFCFVGNAATTRFARVSQIVTYLREFEYYSNITFVSPKSGLPLHDELAAGHVDALTCPAATQAGGKDVYSGDIRLLIPNINIDGRDPVPGNGCWTDHLKSAPACVARDSAHVDCFARGVDDSTWDKHWDSTNGWGDWRQTLGGATDAPPTVASLSATSLDVVAHGVADHALYIKSWDSISGWDAAWALIPGTWGNVSNVGHSCVAHDGVLTCAALFTDNTVYTASRSGVTWSTWVKTNLVANSAPALSTWGQNRLDVFARGPSGTQTDDLVHRWSVEGGVNWTNWTEGLGGDLLGAPACIGRNPYFVGGVRTGNLDCFVRGTDGNIWQRAFSPASNTWGNWTSRGGAATSDPTVESRSGSYLDVFAAGSNGALAEMSSSNGGGTWSGWSDLGDNNGWGSWSDAPWNLNNAYHRACQYNLKLGDNPWCPVSGEFWPCASNPEIVPYLNHTLHEVGHALGLAHEQARADANVSGCGAGYGGGVTDGYITPYDRYSVMHYQYPSCGIDGNYSYAGLSAYDKVALKILYPPPGYPAEFSGNTKIIQGQNLVLTTAWKDWGATISFVANTFVWKVDNVTRSTTADLSLGGLTVGVHTVSLAFDDFLGRHHSSAWTIEVLSAANYTTGVITGAALTPLIPASYTIDIPLVTR